MHDSFPEHLVTIAGRLGLDGKHFSSVSRNTDQRLHEIQSRFVERPGCRWWWEGLRTNVEVASAQFADGQGFRWLPAIVPDASETVWFVAEDGTAKNGFVLFEGQTTAIERVIGECFCFEYYIVSKQMTWLVGENHHNVIFVVGAPVTERFSELIKTIPGLVSNISFR